MSTREKEEGRKMARDDLAREEYKHRQKCGEALPKFSDCEKYAHQRAEQVDKKKDLK